jgi:hypothetical protein
MGKKITGFRIRALPDFQSNPQTLDVHDFGGLTPGRHGSLDLQKISSASREAVATESQNLMLCRPVNSQSINDVRHTLRAPSLLVFHREIASVIKRLATRRENARVIQRGGDSA